MNPSEASSKLVGGPLMQVLRPADWTELYLPATTKKILENLVSAQQVTNFPHLLLHGPPGTGKTSTAKIVAKCLLHRLTPFNYLQLNASNHRGIDTVREKIQGFVNNTAFMQVGQACPFKIVFLDEADEMTSAAFTALRNLMETYAANARFILSCNSVDQIIPAIRSRCLQIRYQNPSVQVMAQTLYRITSARGCHYGSEQIYAAVRRARGDLRKACTYLQVPQVGPEPHQTLQSYLHMDQQTYRAHVKVLAAWMRDDPRGILRHLLGVVTTLQLSPLARFKCLDRLARSEHGLLLGGDPQIQLGVCIAHLRALRRQAQGQPRDK